MDCPNCGAYNATNSTRCRRCDHPLQSEEQVGEGTGSAEPEWGPASGPAVSQPREGWEAHVPSDASRQPPPEQEPATPWAWSEPATPPPSGPVPTMEYGGPLPKGTVPNYLWPSIGATLCCCAPLGIPAIVFASRVDSYLESGNRAAAEEASGKARTWAMASVGVALLLWFIIFCTGQFGGSAA